MLSIMAMPDRFVGQPFTRRDQDSIGLGIETAVRILRTPGEPNVKGTAQLLFTAVGGVDSKALKTAEVLTGIKSVNNVNTEPNTH